MYRVVLKLGLLLRRCLIKQRN